MNKTASNIILSFVVMNYWLFFCNPLQAQQAAPSLQKVLGEGLAAYKSLVERDATVEDSSNDSFLARSLLTYALLGVGTFAIRKGTFKLTVNGPKTTAQVVDDAFPVSFVLYDLDKDVEEITGVSRNHPRMVKEMHALLKKYVQERRSNGSR